MVLKAEDKEEEEREQRKAEQKEEVRLGIAPHSTVTSFPRFSTLPSSGFSIYSLYLLILNVPFEGLVELMFHVVGFHVDRFCLFEALYGFSFLM